jgi:DNA helicase II / ATP-dependent DNA helicase PcrA
MANAIDPNKCKIVIAGPGGGKTSCLVDEALKVLPTLSNNPHKHLAIITYTNAATDEIKSRLSRKVKIPENVFIGTCHSFLIKFIIDPFANILNLLPSEKSYIDQVKLPYNIPNQFAKKNTEIKKANELTTKGVIIYDKLFELSLQILQHPKILKVISNRLLFLYIDEYQDVRVHLHEIIKMIVAQGGTTFFCIGDPLQSIYHFSYGQGQIKDERPKGYSFSNLPLIDFRDTLPESFIGIENNYRSSPAIVSINNLYLTKIGHNQVSNNLSCDIPAYFINAYDENAIYQLFINSISDHQIVDDYTCERLGLVMARQWRYLDGIAIQQNLKRLDNSIQRGSSIYYELKRCILGILGLRQSEAIALISGDIYSDKALMFCKFCFRVFREIIATESDANEIEKKTIALFTQDYCDRVSFNKISTHSFMDMVGSLKKLSSDRTEHTSDFFYSSIHTAKGLEASCVLVLAKTNNELQNWLNFDEITNITNDNFRLGYVAFSRARRLLCFACLEKPTKRTLDLVSLAGFRIV